MGIDSTRLLRKLEPAVRPASAPSAPGAVRAPFERQSFDTLLSLVAAGDLSSDRPVALAPGLELDPPLEAPQLHRLAGAADRAERAGARRAVMVLDGRAMVMDVVARTVEAELTAGPHADHFDIDAAVYVAGDDEDPNVPPGPPGSGLLPLAIAQQLAAARMADPHHDS